MGGATKPEFQQQKDEARSSGRKHKNELYVFIYFYFLLINDVSLLHWRLRWKILKVFSVLDFQPLSWLPIDASLQLEWITDHSYSSILPIFLQLIHH